MSCGEEVDFRWIDEDDHASTAPRVACPPAKREETRASRVTIAWYVDGEGDTVCHCGRRDGERQAGATMAVRAMTRSILRSNLDQFRCALPKRQQAVVSKAVCTYLKVVKRLCGGEDQGQTDNEPSGAHRFSLPRCPTSSGSAVSAPRCAGRCPMRKVFPAGSSRLPILGLALDRCKRGLGINQPCGASRSRPVQSGRS